MSLIQQGEMALSANRFWRLRVARGHLSWLQGIWSLCSDQVAVGLKTHSCCMCDRALSPVSLSTPTKSSSRLLHLHIWVRAGARLQTQTQLGHHQSLQLRSQWGVPILSRRYSGSQLSFSPAVIYHIFIVYAFSLIIVRLIRSLSMQIFGLWYFKIKHLYT